MNGVHPYIGQSLALYQPDAVIRWQRCLYKKGLLGLLGLMNYNSSLVYLRGLRYLSVVVSQHEAAAGWTRS